MQDRYGVRKNIFLTKGKDKAAFRLGSPGEAQRQVDGPHPRHYIEWMFIHRKTPLNRLMNGGKPTMRFLLKVSIPVETGNAAAKEGRLSETIDSILADLKPEAAYFVAEQGMRTAFIIFDMKENAQVPAVAEPWFLALNASVELQPAMSLEDLKKAGPGIESAVKKYA